MDVWLLKIGEPLPLNPEVRKMRTGILADKLIERGHKVRWWASAFEHHRKVMLFKRDQEVSLSDGLTFQILRGCGYRRNISIARYIDHWMVARKFRLQAPKCEPPDAILTSMPSHHLAYEAVRYAYERGIPVLVDVRDLWPDTFLDVLPTTLLKKMGEWVLRQDFFRARYLLEKANGIISVNSEMLNRSLHKAARSRGPWDRVFFIGYRNIHDYLYDRRSLTPSDLKLLEDMKNKKLLVFFGTFGISYDLQLIVKAARIFHRKGKNDVFFILCGDGEKIEKIKKESAGLPNIHFTGWINSKEIRFILKKAWLGLIVTVSNFGNDMAMPNKVFEYCSAGLPLISSLEGEIAHLINHYRFGMNYQPGDLEGFCQAIETLVNNSDLHAEMSANAIAFFNEYGDADKIYSAYAEHIENLVAFRRKAKS